MIDTNRIQYHIFFGEVAEWSKAAVLKTVEGVPLPGFESLPLRDKYFFIWIMGGGGKLVKPVINVLVVDDHPIVRAGISNILEENGINVIGQASCGEDAVRIAKDKNPHVVLMDVRMPGIGGLEATKKMVKNQPNIKIIVLTVCGEEPFPSKFLQAGAVGYLTKGADITEMIHAIQSVYSGKCKHYIGPDIAQQLALKNVATPNGSPLDMLSERELQIMVMITAGQKVQEISDKLYLSPKTVNSYRYRIFDKLGVSSDVELTHLAIRHKILDTYALEIS